jgi:tetratricopeptide (TPR) repeat protein
MDVAPRDASAYLLLGNLRMVQKRPDEAEKLYSEALALNPASLDALAGIVDLTIQRKDIPKALRLVQDEIPRVPNNSEIYLMLGRIEMLNQDFMKAEDALGKAIDFDKNNVPAFMALASLQVSRGEPQKAIEVCKRALQFNPRSLVTYDYLGSILESQNQWQEAQIDYQQALKIQPDYPPAANNLAYLMLEHGENVNVAISLAQAARKGLLNVPNSADTLGWADYHLGLYSAAVDQFQEAIKGDGKNPTYHFHLGLAYEKENNHVLAKKQLTLALEINPKFGQAAEIRKLLAESLQHN